METVVRLNKDYKVVIPRVVRGFYDIKPGDVVSVKISEIQRGGEARPSGLTFHAEVLTGGRITVPAKVREVARLEVGDLLFVDIRKEVE